MIKCFSFLAFLLAWCVLLFGINKLIVKLSYPRKERYNNFRFVVVSIIFVFVVAAYAGNALFIPMVGYLIAMPKVSGFLKFIIPQRSIESIFILVSTLGVNTVFALSFLLLLALTRLLSMKPDGKYIEWESLNGIEKLKHIQWLFINRFYKEQDGKVTLNSSGYTIGIYLKGMKYAVMILLGIEIILLYISVSFLGIVLSGQILSVVRRFYLLPVAFFLLVEQMQLFLEGPEERKLGSVSSSDISERMLGDIESLMHIYQESFQEADALLCAEKGPEQTIAQAGVQANSTGKDQEEKCDDPGVLAIIMNQLRQSGVEMNPTYQNAVIHLLNGESVFVIDNTEGEFTPYYAAYMNYYISQGQRAVVLCSDEEMVQNVQTDLLNYCRSANGNNMLWVIATSSELDNKTGVNVLICTYFDFLNLSLKEKYKDFSDGIQFVVFPDCARLMEQNAVSLELLSSELHSIRSLNSFIFVSDVNNSNIKDRIEQVFYYSGIGLGIYNANLRRKKAGAMVWKGEGKYKLQTRIGIGQGQSPYIGTSLPLALVAIKNDFHKIHVIPGVYSGDEYFLHSALANNASDISRFFDSQVDVVSKINSNVTEAIASEDMKILCVYDDEYNFLNALWRWFKYAGKRGALLHVVSPFYMMREFVADNYKSLITSNNEFMALMCGVPVLSCSRRALLLALFAYCDVSEEELFSVAKRNGWNTTSVDELLREALMAVKQPEQIQSLYNYFEFYEDSRFLTNPDRVVKYTKIKLSDRALVEELMQRLSPAVLEIGLNNRQNLNLLGGNVYNYYLVGQTIPFGGRYYTIDSIGSGTVRVLPVSPNTISDYYSVSDFVLENTKLVDNCADNLRVDFNILEADVTRSIYGYLASNNGNDFSDEATATDITKLETITVPMKNIPILEIKIKKELLGAHAHEGVYLLSVLLNGLFRTLFPRTYQNLIAVADQPYDEDLCESVMEKKAAYSGVDLIKLTTPGIKAVDRSCEDDVVRLFIIEFSVVEYGMVKALYENRTKALTMVYRYLNWYLNSGKGRYMHFGMKEIPGIFAPQELLDMLKSVLRTDEAPFLGEEDSIELIGEEKRKEYECDFCGRKSYFAWRMEDGRIMCGFCHNHVKSQEDEIKTIYELVRNRMEEYFDISISDSIDIRVQSKVAIERVAGKTLNGRILGFYDHENQQLWIERKGPAVAMQSTMAHELTHAWQFAELDGEKMKALETALGKYAKQKKKLLVEGHAVYSQIELMTAMGEFQFARHLDEEFSVREDAYGRGYAIFCAYYARKKDEMGPLTPFEVMKMLIDEILDGGEPVAWPSDIEKL